MKLTWRRRDDQPAELEPPEFAAARQVLRDRRAGRRIPPPDDLLSLATDLRGPGSRRLERRLLAIALEQRPSDLELRQKCALATYKDVELPVGQRLDRALEILEADCAIATTHDLETLALLGAIHKRRWELDGQTTHLERALDCYAYAHEVHVADSDYCGYPGVNAAFILDLLAEPLNLDRARSRQTQHTVDDRHKRAVAIRLEVISRLEPSLTRRTGAYRADDYWPLVTLAEALFGLGGEARHREAHAWLEHAARLHPDDWQRETTARQLARLAQLQGVDLLSASPGAAVQALNVLLPDGAVAVTSVSVGKVGLALSGGGFRASLFHIGVLARLAELDVLRHVEVLSCVSGGSIVGADYYLRLRRRLQTQPDGTLGRDGYVRLVEELATDFRQGVERNLRARLLANPLTLAQQVFRPGYNVSDRAGELYEKYFFRSALRSPRRRGLRRLARHQRPLMRDLTIHPCGAPQGFRPREDNWLRSDKVPILIINAATLNTGHGWQFTATWMGEPPSAVEDDVDRNARLRRMYYWQAPSPHDKLTLGTAVAASAAVPGIFPPITLRGLYPHTVVRLADGGVFDNQGIAGLVDQDCSVMIVSDASGQMHEVDAPAAFRVPVLRRASGILSSQVRRAQWQDLRSRRQGGVLRGLLFLHLRSGLGGGARDWTRCQEPQENEVLEPPTFTPYGVSRDVQRRLARLRTDLDSFNDIEATALMTSGYRMAAYELPRSLPTVPVSAEASHLWPFLAAFDEHSCTPSHAPQTLRVLEVGQHRWLRPVRRAVRRQPATRAV
jgi:Tetratricopeptide Repeats-Sensor/Patatin-like phospholipase